MDRDIAQKVIAIVAWWRRQGNKLPRSADGETVTEISSSSSQLEFNFKGKKFKARVDNPEFYAEFDNQPNILNFKQVTSSDIKEAQDNKNGTTYRVEVKPQSSLVDLDGTKIIISP